jgi:hypothetical protein
VRYLSATVQGFVVELAQEADDVVVTTAGDDTGRTVAIVVAALVGLAVLLAVLTIWYWRHTDPRRRVAARPAPVAARPGAVAGPAPAPQEPARPAPQAPGGITAEEWLRLTGPSEQPPRRPGP